MSARELITEHLDLWTAAVTTKSTAGRGSSSGKRGKIELTGIKKLRELVLKLGFSGLLTGDTPKDWESVTLGDVGQWGSGGTPTKSRTEYYGGDIPWLVIGDLNDGVVKNAESFISQEGLENSSAKLVPPGTLLIAMYGSIGKLGITSLTCATNQAIAHCVPDKTKIELRFLFFFFLGKKESLLNMGQGLAQQNISQKILKKVELALPTLEVQHRIVEKINELMALCDRLEQQVGDQLEAQEVLVETLLDALTRSADASEVTENWARIAEHFDTLFTTEASIDKLKQTILQLAVMGRLVEQDPNDEPASVLLERIAEEKARLVKEGKIKKPKQFANPSDQDKIFSLPDGWEWASIASTGITSTGKTPSTKEKLFFDGDIPFIGPGQITTGGEVNQPEKFLSEAGLVESDEAMPGDLVVVCIGGSIGKCAKIQTRCGFNQQINKVRPLLVHPDYLLSTLSTDFVRKAILEKSTGSATPIINRSKWESICVPLPPLQEQHRIVDKVDELMALCDHLKTRLVEAGETRTQLAEAVVEQAVN